MSRSLYENHWGSPTLTLLNVLVVLGVLNVLYVLYVLNVLHVLHVLNMLMDASLASWEKSHIMHSVGQSFFPPIRYCCWRYGHT